MADYLICPHCGKKIQDYAFAKALREGVGFVEELGRDVGPALGFWVGKMTGIGYGRILRVMGSRGGCAYSRGLCLRI